MVRRQPGSGGLGSSKHLKGVFAPELQRLGLGALDLPRQCIWGTLGYEKVAFFPSQNCLHLPPPTPPSLERSRLQHLGHHRQCVLRGGEG